jgi:hypothetical protein
MKYMIGFGRFWYDFIVGDSVILALGGAGALAVNALLVSTGVGALAEWLLPAVVIGTLAASLRGTSH